MNGGLEI